jgi:hypothetical protein
LKKHPEDISANAAIALLPKAFVKRSLERAKKGEFQSGAMFFVDQDSTICTVITKTDNKHLLIAGCNHLLHSMLSED